MDLVIISAFCTLAAILGLLALYFAFRAKQAAGISRVNNIEAKYGGGSFGTGIKSNVMMFTWGVLCIVASFGVLASLGMAANRQKARESSEKLDTYVIPAETPVLLAPIATISERKEPPAEATISATAPAPSAPIGENERPASSQSDNSASNASAEPQKTEIQLPSVIQVCDEESNIISKTNCRWQQCAKEENLLKAECELFKNKQ